MAKAKEQFLDKGLLEFFQYIYIYIYFQKKCLGVLPNFMLPEKNRLEKNVLKIKI